MYSDVSFYIYIYACIYYFVTMATGVGWGPVSMIPLHCPTPKTPTFVQESGTSLLYKPTYTQLYVQIVNFSLPWQQGSVGANLNDTMKVADLKNSHCGTKIWDISPIRAEL